MPACGKCCRGWAYQHWPAIAIHSHLKLSDWLENSVNSFLRVLPIALKPHRSSRCSPIICITTGLLSVQSIPDPGMQAYTGIEKKASSTQPRPICCENCMPTYECKPQ